MKRFDYHSLPNRILQALCQAVFPTRCLACGAYLNPEKPFIGYPADAGFEDGSRFPQGRIERFEKLAGPFLCDGCVKGFLPVESPLCSSCGIMFKSREGADHVCGECLTAPKHFRTARAAGVYGGPLMALIHSYKYREKLQLARPLAILLFSSFIQFWDRQSIDLILPVPLHIKKHRMRGFNQAFQLGRQWPRLTEAVWPGSIPFHMDRHLLVRNRWTEPQTGLGRKQRKANIKNAFSVTDASKLDDKNVLLIDDVYTTGATVGECAKVLLRSGAKHVDVLTLARAM